MSCCHKPKPRALNRQAKLSSDLDNVCEDGSAFVDHELVPMCYTFCFDLRFEITFFPGTIGMSVSRNS